jgi:hypothetical protein
MVATFNELIPTIIISLTQQHVSCMSSMMEASDRIKRLGEIEQPILQLQAPLAVCPS